MKRITIKLTGASPRGLNRSVDYSDSDKALQETFQCTFQETSQYIVTQERNSQDYLKVQELVSDFNETRNTLDSYRIGIFCIDERYGFDVICGSKSALKQGGHSWKVSEAENEQEKRLPFQELKELLGLRQKEMKAFGEYLKELVLSQ